jgi:hypothetical protein
MMDKKQKKLLNKEADKLIKITEKRRKVAKKMGMVYAHTK